MAFNHKSISPNKRSHALHEHDAYNDFMKTPSSVYTLSLVAGESPIWKVQDEVNLHEHEFSIVCPHEACTSHIVSEYNT